MSHFSCPGSGVLGSGSWFKGLGSGVQGHGFRVLGWVGGPPKGLQSAAVTLVTSSWRVELDNYKLKAKEVQS